MIAKKGHHAVAVLYLKSQDLDAKKKKKKRDVNNEGKEVHTGPTRWCSATSFRGVTRLGWPGAKPPGYVEWVWPGVKPLRHRGDSGCVVLDLNGLYPLVLVLYQDLFTLNHMIGTDRIHKSPTIHKRWMPVQHFIASRHSGGEFSMWAKQHAQVNPAN